MSRATQQVARDRKIQPDVIGLTPVVFHRIKQTLTFQFYTRAQSIDQKSRNPWKNRKLREFALKHFFYITKDHVRSQGNASSSIKMSALTTEW